MHNRYFLTVIVCLALTAVLSSCCEPGHKNSQPLVIDSLFQQTYGHDFDLYSTQNSQTPTIPDSGYYPIYTFGIQNTGTDDDDFTVQFRYFNAGFDITEHVPAGKIVLFKTPVMPPDSITMNARYFYPILPAADTNPPIPYAYYALFQPNPDSTKIRSMRPTITVLYGSIDNGPEACNTPASQYVINIDQLPVR